jgi:hypothetical protein
LDYCEGGKYIVEFFGGIALAALVVTLFVLTLPASGFFAICGAIGAGIATVNAITNLATSFRAAYTACNGDPTWARIYSKQNTLSQVIRETNFNNGIMNKLSYLGADVIDATEIFCCIVGIAQIGKSIKKLFSKNSFNTFKKGSLHLGDFKSSIKKNFADIKVNVKKGFTDFKVNVKNIFGKVDDVDDIPELNKLDDVHVNVLDDILPEREFKAGTLSNIDARKWYLENEAKIPNMIDNSLPLKQQAKQALDLRNQFRTQTRELMSDRNLAESLYKSDPNKTWQEMIQRQIDKGLTGDDIYKGIIESSQKSRPSVNKSLGLFKEE